MAKSQVVKEHSETLSGHSCRQAVGVGFVLMAILVPLYFSPLFYEYEIPKLVIFQVLTVAMAVLWVVGMRTEAAAAAPPRRARPARTANRRGLAAAHHPRRLRRLHRPRRRQQPRRRQPRRRRRR